MSMILDNSLPRGITVKTHGLLQLPDVHFYIQGEPNRLNRDMTVLQFTRLLQIFLYPEEDGNLTEDALGLTLKGEGPEKFVQIIDFSQVPATPLMDIRDDDFAVVVKYVFTNTPIVTRRLINYDEETGTADLETCEDDRLKFLKWLEDQSRPDRVRQAELYDWLITLNVTDGVFRGSVNGEEFTQPGLVPADSIVP